MCVCVFVCACVRLRVQRVEGPLMGDDAQCQKANVYSYRSDTPVGFLGVRPVDKDVTGFRFLTPTLHHETSRFVARAVVEILAVKRHGTVIGYQTCCAALYRHQLECGGVISRESVKAARVHWTLFRFGGRSWAVD